MHKEIQEDENKGPAGEMSFPQFAEMYQKRSFSIQDSST
jgi:hypothetical protein